MKTIAIKQLFSRNKDIECRIKVKPSRKPKKLNKPIEVQRIVEFMHDVISLVHTYLITKRRRIITQYGKYNHMRISL